ncbi:hypothetical protein [Parafilimonas terrae]|uniref:Uncharacterized protein n=1 Tax=Parafilimonas terrae TaxID=1465490 RepID=A0A1I5ZH31_9BACT|nr:hypothetical protein [Parafilimonas terrae]SFQ55829.1 hypothetical protein SAMN05444277_1294 [Parafilimonas terrae]
MKNLFLEIHNQVSDIWDERKGLDWTNKTHEQQRIINRLENKVKKLRETLNEFDKEFIFLRDFYLGEK